MYIHVCMCTCTYNSSVTGSLVVAHMPWLPPSSGGPAGGDGGAVWGGHPLLPQVPHGHQGDGGRHRHHGRPPLGGSEGRGKTGGRKRKCQRLRKAQVQVQGGGGRICFFMYINTYQATCTHMYMYVHVEAVQILFS